jgi:DNA-binding CsgD family transcriptional regulator
MDRSRSVERQIPESAVCQMDASALDRIVARKLESRARMNSPFRETTRISSDLQQLAEVRAALLAAVPVGVVLVDPFGEVVEFNPAAQHLLGLAEVPLALAELSQRVWDPITHGPIRSAELPWRRALGGEEVHYREIAVGLPLQEEQTRTITMSARPFRHPGWSEPGCVVVAFDRVQLLARRTPPVLLPPYLQRVLTRLCQGRTTEEISTELNVTVATTRLYIKRLRMRFGVSNRSQLVLRAIEMGLYPATGCEVRTAPRARAS